MNTIIAGLTALIIGLTAYIGGLKDQPTPTFGSVTQGSEYVATSTKIYTGATGVANLTVLSNYDGCSSTCPGTVGSVAITGANTGITRLWNATTSNVTLRALATSSLTYIEIPASTPAGTYTFDANFNDGILYEAVSGTLATSTITWRNR